MVLWKSVMVEITMRKGLAGLATIDGVGEEVLAGIGVGDIVRVRITRPRNLAFHNKFFALCTLVAENTEAVKDVDELVFRLKIATGHCRQIMRDDGLILYEPRSISFAQMDETSFGEFYKKCVDIICLKLIPGMDEKALQAEVLEMIN